MSSFGFRLSLTTGLVALLTSQAARISGRNELQGSEADEAEVAKSRKLKDLKCYCKKAGASGTKPPCLGHGVLFLRHSFGLLGLVSCALDDGSWTAFFSHMFI